MYHKISVTLILAVLFILQPLHNELFANNIITEVKVEQAEFSPLNGEKAQILFSLAREAAVTLHVYNFDNYLVATPLDKKVCTPGTNTVFWNGRNEEGKVVADDAYYFTVEAVDKFGGRELYNPLSFSGGEIVQVGLVNTGGGVSYELPQDALVRIRIGIHDGPLLKTLLDWEPRRAGKHFEKWDGKDDSGVILVDSSDVSVDIQAYSLPTKSLITNGSGLRYAELIVGDSAAEAQMNQIQLSRQAKQRLLVKKKTTTKQASTKNLHPHYFMNRATDRAPRFQVKITSRTDAVTNSITKTVQAADSPAAGEVVSGTITMTIDLEELTGIILANQRYEVIVYIDNEFHMEDEQGYHPYTFNLNTDNLTNGNHTVTFNVATLTGQVGSASIIITVQNA